MNNYSDQQIIDFVASSSSWAQVLRKLDLPLFGGNYRTLQRRAMKLKIDHSHFNHLPEFSENKITKQKADLEDLLSDNPQSLINLNLGSGRQE